MKKILLMIILFMASPALAQTHYFGTYQVNGATNQAVFGISGNLNVSNWGPLCYALYDGSTKLGATGAVGANGWPPGVTVPQHRYELAGNYNDSGPSPYNLGVGGGSPAFTADWANRANQALSLNGSSWVSQGYGTPDIQQIGGTFSILLEANWPTVNAWRDFIKVYDTGKKSWSLSFQESAILTVTISTDNINDSGVYSTGWAPTANQNYQIIFTLGGGYGNVYVNGVRVYGPVSMLTPANSTGSFFIGGGVSNISRVAILKGTAWTQADVDKLLAYWVAGDEANTFARRYAATPANMQVLNKGTLSALSSDTWGAEAAGKYGYSYNALRYHTGSTEPTISPGMWR